MIFKGPDISILTMIIQLEYACQPIIISFMRIDSFIKFFSILCIGLPAYLNAFQRRHFRNIYIQKSPGGKTILQHLFGNDLNVGEAFTEISIICKIIE